MNTSFGVIGLGVMGRNLALNLITQDLKVVLYSYAAAEMSAFRSPETDRENVQFAASLEDFVKQLDQPRKILLMVTSGSPVDDIIQDLAPLLDEQDIIIDGGNSFFEDTMRRSATLKQQHIHFIGAGISGGAEGARTGASIMVGCAPEAFTQTRDLFDALSTEVDSQPCFAHMGPDGAGHFVKMVHNGIEYGIMQLIAESYRFMKETCNWSDNNIQQAFELWNQGALASYLIEITAKILKHKDDQTGSLLIDLISDQAEQKGTGQWTVNTAMKLGAPIPTIIAAVTERYLSAMKDERLEAAEKLQNFSIQHEKLPTEDWLRVIEQALLGSITTTYAQGFAMIRIASEHYRWQTRLSDVASLWRGGCIIRSVLLETFKQAFEQDARLTNLLIAPQLQETLASSQQPWRKLLAAATLSGKSMPAMSASLAYVDSYSSGRLPTNMIQAQRDYFGAHTFERTDKPGKFHTDWNV